MADGTDGVDMGGHDLVTRILLKFSFLVYIQIFSNKQLYLRLNWMVTSLGILTQEMYIILHIAICQKMYIHFVFAKHLVLENMVQIDNISDGKRYLAERANVMWTVHVYRISLQEFMVFNLNY